MSPGQFHKHIQIGPGYDEPYATGTGICCVCCDVCTDINPVGLDSCPAQCCPCPPIGDVCVTLVDLAGTCPNLDGQVITLGTGAGWALCESEYPGPQKGGVDSVVCFDPNATGCLSSGDYQKSLMFPAGAPADASGWPHEKWATDGSIVLCAGDEGAACSGETVQISLVCCDFVSAAEQQAGFEDDCHGCRYQFRWVWSSYFNPPPTANWVPNSPCTCPDGYYEALETLIPPNNCTHLGPNVFTWPMSQTQCGSGNADDWKVVFEIHNESWKCDCCDGEFDEIACTGNVSLRAIVTPEPPGGC